MSQEFYAARVTAFRPGELTGASTYPIGTDAILVAFNTYRPYIMSPKDVTMNRAIRRGSKLSVLVCALALDCTKTLRGVWARTAHRLQLACILRTIISWANIVLDRGDCMIMSNMLCGWRVTGRGSRDTNHLRTCI